MNLEIYFVLWYVFEKVVDVVVNIIDVVFEVGKWMMLVEVFDNGGDCVFDVVFVGVVIVVGGVVVGFEIFGRYCWLDENEVVVEVIVVEDFGCY